MLIYRRWRLFLWLFAAVIYAVPALAQQPSATGQPAPTAAPPAPKKPPKNKPSAARATTAEPAAAVAGGAKPTLLGQFGDWGAYMASPGGKKICFAIAKPASSETNPTGKTRNPSYIFVASRPAEKVSNEISIIIGYPFKRNSDATIAIGSSSFTLYTQQDGAWIKNATEEAQLLEAMRGGQNAVVKGTSAKGTHSTDVFSLKGLAQALDRSGQDCKP
jgi:hypothetical protein